MSGTEEHCLSESADHLGRLKIFLPTQDSRGCRLVRVWQPVQAQHQCLLDDVRPRRPCTIVGAHSNGPIVYGSSIIRAVSIGLNLDKRKLDHHLVLSRIL